MASPRAVAGEAPTTPPAGEYPRNFCVSQEHLLSASRRNPEPTTVPPPVAGLAGALVAADLGLAEDRALAAALLALLVLAAVAVLVHLLL